MAKKQKISNAVATVAAVVQAVEAQATQAETGVVSEAVAPVAQADMHNAIVESMSTVAPVTVVQTIQPTTDKGALYRSLNTTQFDVEIAPDTKAPLTNKRALVCALYVLVCEACGVKVTEKRDCTVRLLARLLPYANTGYSKQKGRILAGNEVTPSGMLAYARFVHKPDAAKLLPDGELYARTQQASRIAQHIFNTYAGVEGLEACKVACAQRTSK
jgi:hypothetical protein